MGEPFSEEESEERQQLNKQRRQYVSKMERKYGGRISREIKRAQKRDYKMRDIQSPENDDRFYDMRKMEEEERAL